MHPVTIFCMALMLLLTWSWVHDRSLQSAAIEVCAHAGQEYLVLALDNDAVYCRAPDGAVHLLHLER